MGGMWYSAGMGESERPSNPLDPGSKEAFTISDSGWHNEVWQVTLEPRHARILAVCDSGAPFISLGRKTASSIPAWRSVE